MARSMPPVSRFQKRGKAQSPSTSIPTGKGKILIHIVRPKFACCGPEFLYLEFVAHYRLLTVFEDADSNGRRDKLWDRDAAEVFLQPDPAQPRRYKEFEVSPNGFWIDLEINDGVLQYLKSGLQRRVNINQLKKTWTAELAMPIKSLTQHFDPTSVWRVNFFRVEGPSEPRFYSSWQPTNTPEPNFHAPERFGFLKFEPMLASKSAKGKPSKPK